MRERVQVGVRGARQGSLVIGKIYPCRVHKHFASVANAGDSEDFSVARQETWLVGLKLLEQRGANTPGTDEENVKLKVHNLSLQHSNNYSFQLQETKFHLFPLLESPGSLLGKLFP